MLDTADPAGFELIDTIGFPLPVTVICELLGIPAEARHLFGPWSADASRMIDGDVDAAPMQRGLMAFIQTINYHNGIFAERRANTRVDMPSALLDADDAGETLH